VNLIDRQPTDVLNKHLESLKTAEAHEQISERRAIEKEDLEAIHNAELNLQHLKQQILLF